MPSRHPDGYQLADSSVTAESEKEKSLVLQARPRFTKTSLFAEHGLARETTQIHAI